jgi:hypothetical protein
MATPKTVLVETEFIRLARAMLDARKAGLHSQKEWRRAENLTQLFDAKLRTIEKVIAMVEKTEEVPAKLL